MLNSKNKNILPRSRPLTFQLIVFPFYLYYFSYFPWLDNNKKGTQKKKNKMTGLKPMKEKLTQFEFTTFHLQ